MRNFILLIRRFWNLILFLALEVLSVVMIAKSRNLQGMDILSSSNSVVGYLYKKQNEVVYYFQLRKLNQELMRENAELNKQLSQLTYVDTFFDAVAEIREPQAQSTNEEDLPKQDSLIRPTGTPKVIHYAEYSYTPARVIKNSVSNSKINFITLNRGSSSGIEKGMAVVTGNGIVGRVSNVSPNYATVASILSDRKVSARLKDGTYSFIFWEPGNPDHVVMEKIAITQPVKVGDSIYTTAYSFFPENVLIGTVKQVDTIRASNSKSLKIKLSTNFRNLQYVYVVKNKMGEERRRLETQTSSGHK